MSSAPVALPGAQWITQRIFAPDILQKERCNGVDAETYDAQNRP
jgi:hypothetical protein